MNLLAKNLSANLLSNVWLTVLMLGLTPIYIWFLGMESYGLIGFYLSWISILSILDTGISVTAAREIAWRMVRPEVKGTIPTLIKSLEVTYWSVILILGLGILIGAWFFGTVWFQADQLQPDMIRNVMMLMALSLIVQVPSGLYVGGLMGLQRQVECSGLLAFFGTIRGIGSVVVLGSISSDVQTFFLWQIVVSILQTGFMRWTLWRRVCIRDYPAKFSANLVLTLKEYAGSVVLIAILGMIMSQADKMILSRKASLEEFGFYMLAWAVASGLSRAATPLIQAFSPKFTELVSRGDEEGVARQVRIASQLMSALIIPPAAFIIVLSKPILMIWLGSEVVAEKTAPILAVMVVGTMFSCCSFPSLSVLYSRKQLKPVVTLHLVCVFGLIPPLILFVHYFSIMGAACMWCVYGVVIYIGAQIIGFYGPPNKVFFSSILKNFLFPFFVVFLFASASAQWLSEINNVLTFLILLLCSLLLGLVAILFLCADLREIALEKFK